MRCCSEKGGAGADSRDASRQRTLRRCFPHRLLALPLAGLAMFTAGWPGGSGPARVTHSGGARAMRRRRIPGPSETHWAPTRGRVGGAVEPDEKPGTAAERSARRRTHRPAPGSAAPAPSPARPWVQGRTARGANARAAVLRDLFPARQHPAQRALAVPEACTRRMPPWRTHSTCQTTTSSSKHSGFGCKPTKATQPPCAKRSNWKRKQGAAFRRPPRSRHHWPHCQSHVDPGGGSGSESLQSTLPLSLVRGQETCLP